MSESKKKTRKLPLSEDDKYELSSSVHLSTLLPWPVNTQHNINTVLDCINYLRRHLQENLFWPKEKCDAEKCAHSWDNVSFAAHSSKI